MKKSMERVAALTRKEFFLMLRAPSSLLLGVVLPLVLILLIGYGMSLDVKHVPLAVVMEDRSPTARAAVRFTEGSEYFSPTFVSNMQEAEALMRAQKVNAILCVPVDFSAGLARGEGRMQLLLNGVEATTAMSVQNYVEAGVLLKQVSGGMQTSTKGQAQLVSRIWFNDANTSAWFFVPGLLMLVLTITGVFLTSVVMAKEWEHGTFESLFVTPVRVWELIISKLIPYFCIAVSGMLLCLVSGRLLYDLPMRGSLAIILGVSMLYLVVALGIGLVISAVTKSQFLACQVALLISFMPSVMLSGFLFDLRSEPWGIQLASAIFPTTYYLQMIKSLFLSGNYFPLLLKNTAILFGYAVFFFGLASKLTRKKVE